MKILVLDSLRVFNPKSRKNGLYPGVVALHEKAGWEAIVVTLTVPSRKDLQYFRKASRYSLISPSRGHAALIFFLLVLGKLLNSGFFGEKAISVGMYSCFSQVAREIKNGRNISVVTALTSALRSGLFARQVSTQFGIPYMVFEHKTNFARGFASKAEATSVRQTIEQASLVAPVSEALRLNIESFLGHNRVKQIVTPNPTDMASGPGGHIARAEDFPQGRFAFGAWTAWRQIKRLDLLLDSLAHILQSHPQTCLIVAGPFPEWAKTRVEEENLGNHVLLLGEIDRGQIKTLADIVDCVLVPSDHETFALPVIEGFAAGIPAVVTRCGGPEDLVSSLSLGRTVPKGDYLKFANAMKEVIDNYECFDSEAIKVHYTKFYGEEAIMKKWRGLYVFVDGLQK